MVCGDAYPVRAARVLGVTKGASFSEKVIYIYRKQLEEADIIVINKADRPGASSLLRVLESAGSPPDRPRCMLLSVPDGLGIKELDLALQSPRARPGRGRDAAHLAMVMDDLVGQARASLRGPKVRADVLRLIRSGQRSAAVRRVVEELTLG